MTLFFLTDLQTFHIWYAEGAYPAGISEEMWCKHLFHDRKKSNSGEHSAVLAMDASFCSGIPCCAALTAAGKEKWNAAWAKSPVIKNSYSCLKKAKTNPTTFTKKPKVPSKERAWLCPQHPVDWAPFPSLPGRAEELHNGLAGRWALVSFGKHPSNAAVRTAGSFFSKHELLAGVAVVWHQISGAS